MFSHGRSHFPYIALALLAAATAWALSFGTLPPADFTFVNETEPRSVDPAVITGVPESRLVNALFEGLVNWDPKTLAPIPGVADRWEISTDQKHYTFHLRSEARWSDGTPVIASDFVWSWRRVLDPASASEYVSQLWYLRNAKKYTAGPLSPGDPVEVELPKSDDALVGARGEVLKGTLLKIEVAGTEKKSSADGAPSSEELSGDEKTYVVRIDGHERRYKAGGGPGTENCREVLLDFEEVGVHAIDDKTLTIELEDATPYFLFLTGFQTYCPVNRRCVETYGYPEWIKPGHIVCNGAFCLQLRRIRDRVRLVKSETYWNRKEVKLNIVDALAISSSTTALNLYMTHRADWITTVPPTAAPKLVAEKRPDFSPSVELGVNFYKFNVTRPPLNNPKVRRALALIIDRQEIIDAATRCGEVPARSLVPPGMDYEPVLCPDRNVTEAKRLLAEAGYPNGRDFPRLEILYNADEGHKTTAELIQSWWKTHLGINVGLRPLEWGVYQAAEQKLDYDICRAAWLGDYLDPNTFLDLFTSDNENNQSGWKNLEYDRLIRTAAQTTDTNERWHLFQQAERILYEELPIVPLYFYVSKNMVQPYVKGFYPNLLNQHPLWAISIDEEAKRRQRPEGAQ